VRCGAIEALRGVSLAVGAGQVVARGKALQLAHRAYVLETGSIVMSGTGQELLASPEVRKAYLGE